MSFSSSLLIWVALFGRATGVFARAVLRTGTPRSGPMAMTSCPACPGSLRWPAGDTACVAEGTEGALASSGGNWTGWDAAFLDGLAEKGGFTYGAVLVLVVAPG